MSTNFTDTSNTRSQVAIQNIPLGTESKVSQQINFVPPRTASYFPIPQSIKLDTFRISDGYVLGKYQATTGNVTDFGNATGLTFEVKADAKQMFDLTGAYFDISFDVCGGITGAAPSFRPFEQTNAAGKNTQLDPSVYRYRLMRSFMSKIFSDASFTFANSSASTTENTVDVTATFDFNRVLFMDDRDISAGVKTQRNQAPFAGQERYIASANAITLDSYGGQYLEITNINATTQRVRVQIPVKDLFVSLESFNYPIAYNSIIIQLNSMSTTQLGAITYQNGQVANQEVRLGYGNNLFNRGAFTRFDLRIPYIVATEAYKAEYEKCMSGFVHRRILKGVFQREKLTNSVQSTLEFKQGGAGKKNMCMCLRLTNGNPQEPEKPYKVPNAGGNNVHDPGTPYRQDKYYPFTNLSTPNGLTAVTLQTQNYSRRYDFKMEGLQPIIVNMDDHYLAQDQTGGGDEGDGNAGPLIWTQNKQTGCKARQFRNLNYAEAYTEYLKIRQYIDSDRGINPSGSTGSINYEDFLNGDFTIVFPLYDIVIDDSTISNTFTITLEFVDPNVAPCITSATVYEPGTAVAAATPASYSTQTAVYRQHIDSGNPNDIYCHAALYAYNVIIYNKVNEKTLITP